LELVLELRNSLFKFRMLSIENPPISGQGAQSIWQELQSKERQGHSHTAFKNEKKAKQRGTGKQRTLLPHDHL